MKLDKLEPTLRFEGAQEEKERLDVEEYKLFRRWEWLVEPRAYPSGRLDLEQLATFRAQVKEIDDELTSKQTGESPLKRQYFHPLWKTIRLRTPSAGPIWARQLHRVRPKKREDNLPLRSGRRNWKSTNSGATWSPKFDFQPTLSVGDIAVDQKNTKVLYVGHGRDFLGTTFRSGAAPIASASKK